MKPRKCALREGGPCSDRVEGEREAMEESRGAPRAVTVLTVSLPADAARRLMAKIESGELTELAGIPVLSAELAKDETR